MSNYSSSTLEYDNPNSSWYKTRNLIPDGSTVLDIGCSSGNFGKNLIDTKHCIVDGVEMTQSDVVLARKHLRTVLALNIESEANKINEKYDVVFFGDVIEHLVDPVSTLQAMRRLLKPKGRIVFSIPNMSHMLVRLAVMRGEFGYGETGLLDKTHLHFYTINEVKRIFAEAGFAIKTLDFVRRDVPLEVINRELSRVGLVAEKKFEKVAQSVDAAAYQIIGEARISDKMTKLAKLPDVYPRVNEMHKHLEKLKRLHADDIERITQHYERRLKDQQDAVIAMKPSVRLKRKLRSLKQSKKTLENND